MTNPSTAEILHQIDIEIARAERKIGERKLEVSCLQEKVDVTEAKAFENQFAQQMFVLMTCPNLYALQQALRDAEKARDDLLEEKNLWLAQEALRKSV